MNKKLSNKPDLPSAGTLCSNFDFTIDERIKPLVENGTHTGDYTGWNFFGNIWYDIEWYCEVKQYCYVMKIVEASTLEELMGYVSDEFGYE